MRTRSLRSSAMLTGFISLDEVQRTHSSSSSSSTSSSSSSPTSSSSSSSDWKRRRSVLSALKGPKWVYAVLHQGKLRCYRRRADIKLNREPCRVVLLDLQATLVGERQSLIVQSRATGKMLRLRVHATSSSTYLQWLTALYLARLDASGGLTPTLDAKKKTKAVKTKAVGTRRKRVTFNEETSECVHRGVDEEDDDGGCTTLRETVDLGELFYSRADLAAFRASHLQTTQENEKSPLRVGRTLVRSLVAKLRRRKASQSDEEHE